MHCWKQERISDVQRSGFVCVCVCVCVCLRSGVAYPLTKAEIYPGKNGDYFTRGRIKVQKKKKPNKGSIGFVSEKVFCKF